MRGAIHPRFVATMAICGNCGTSFETRSTVSELRLDVCSHCHPAYTDQPERRSGGSQVERFNRRWGTHAAAVTSS